MNSSKKLFLIDSYALIFRSYYAFIKNPMRNSKGMNTSTVFGFTLTLHELLRKEDPTHIIAAFDASAPTFRHEMYKPYKANRDATPEDVRESVPWIKKLLMAYKIPVIEKAGYEADDIIGTIAKNAEKQGFEVYMVTPDKDFAQLVSDKIFMYKPGRSGNPAEILGIPEILEKFQIKDTKQVIDILALWGDSSDNIPGAPGIGEKTAKKLISEFGTVEGIYSNIEKLKGKQKENLLKSKKQVELSRKLAKIIEDVPIEVDYHIAQRVQGDMKAIEQIFDQLEFKNLKSRILGINDDIKDRNKDAQGSLFEEKVEKNIQEAHPIRNITNVAHDYQLLESEEEVRQLVSQLKDQKVFCFDTETTGLDVIESEMVGISFAFRPHQAFYIPVNVKDKRRKEILKLLKELFTQKDLTVVGQNLKYDLHILKNSDLDVKGALFDTMVAHYLVSPDKKHGLDDMAMEYLEYQKISTEELIGGKGQYQKNFRDLDPGRVRDYACEDADITWQLYEKLADQVEQSPFKKLAIEVEMPLVRVLMEMEHHGVKLDTGALSDFAHELRQELTEIEEKIHQLAGVKFNVGSPKQLGEVLFEHMKIIPDAKKTKNKQYSTSEEVLQKISGKHEIVSRVLEFRSAKKLLGTYVEALPRLIHQKTNRIHTSFNQTLVSTGRLSSNNPNLQNIPIREERGRRIRKAFTSSDQDHRFLSADYSQIELRLMAHLSKDRNMIRAFINNEDIHTATASKVYGVKPQEVDREMRTKAKTANFGIIYGISAFGLAQRMHIPRKEAGELIEGYFINYPAVREYMDQCIKYAREKGYVETLFGRRRYLPDILSRNSMIRGNAERNAINTPIQGTAADIIKMAMVDIRNRLLDARLSAEMVIQVHDELNFNVPVAELQETGKIVRHSMEQVVSLSVPLVVEMKDGSNWLEAH